MGCGVAPHHSVDLSKNKENQPTPACRWRRLSVAVKQLKTDILHFVT
jgi:hypothetical protein